MESEPILKEAHAMKGQLAREVNYDIHALCERIRHVEARHAERLVKSLPEKSS